MNKHTKFRPSTHLSKVSYEIRGALDKRAQELEKQGYEILKLNIGNPGAFGFRAPSSILRGVAGNVSLCSGYCPSKGILSAREAVVADSQTKGITGVTVEDVFIGNGVSELIMMTMEALLEPGDEVLVPSPDYPLWSAAVVINGAHPVYYPCREEKNYIPLPSDVEKLISPKTRALVLINPNNPTGAVYPESTLRNLVKIAEKHKLIIFSDEIYDKILYDSSIHVPVASLCKETLCATFSGLSKVYRAAGLRTGWVYFSGDKTDAGAYLDGLELLSSLRLCANVPGQYAVQTALGGVQSIYELTASTGRLGRQRQCLINAVRKSSFLSMIEPKGALYGFIKVDTNQIPHFDDRAFAMRLLEEKNVLIVPGTGFHVDYPNCFRTTFLPDESVIEEVFSRVESLLEEMAQKINSVSEVV